MSDSAASDPHGCYHCGLPVPENVDLPVVIDDQPKAMCCVGCQAVAQAIVDSGLTEYYRHRDAMPESRRESMPKELEELGLFDHPDFQQSFVKPIGEHEREASLILEGITCAACVWLNEAHVGRLPGVTAISINYATRRARVRWDERELKLSEILGAIAAIGYRAYPFDAERSEQIAQRERRSALWRVFVAGFGMMQVMMYAVPVYLADDGTMSPEIEALMRWSSLLLTLPVVLYSAVPFFQRAWRDIGLRRLGMDVPVALGIGAAFVASCWATVTQSGQVYFDSVSMFVFFLLCGRYLEMMARQKAVRGVEEIAKVLPVFVERLLPDGDTEKVPLSQIQVGDPVLVRPGEVIPADGVVRDGRSQVNEALLTGESRPISKEPGSVVTGGTLNIGSALQVGVTQVGDQTRLAAIQRLMERAASEKPSIVVLADKIAGWFIVALLLLAVVTAGIWWYVDPEQALWVFVSVLVVSCPCALSLATPAALTVATDVLARLGVLVTRGHAIETLARAKYFVFDKTGTLTYGQMTLQQVDVLGEQGQEACLSLAVALEKMSEHAIGKALVEAQPASVSLPEMRDVRMVTGQGVVGYLGGDEYRIGRADFVAGLVGQALPTRNHPSESTLIYLGRQGAWLAAFVLADSVRAGAKELVAQLHEQGCQVEILSGDGEAVVAAVAEQLGITQCHALQTPQDKHQRIVALQAAGHVVAMVGDGVNDAPVLAQAQVSIAMGGGTELARNHADVVLLNESLAMLGQGIVVAKRTTRITRQNLLWSFLYNFTAIPLAMFGWVTPWMAGIGMSASSLLVVLNALRLKR